MNHSPPQSALLLLACAFFFHSPPRTPSFRPSATAAPAPSRPSTSPPSSSPLAPTIAPGGTLQARPRPHARRALARLLDQRRRLRRAAQNQLDAPRRHHRRPHAVSHPQPPSARPAHGLRLRRRSRLPHPPHRAANRSNPAQSTSTPMVNWLVCREVCIPGKAHLGLNLTVVPRPLHPPSPSAPSAKPSTSSPSLSRQTPNSPSPAARPTSSSPSPPASARPTPSSIPSIRSRSPTPPPSRSNRSPTASASASAAPTTSQTLPSQPPRRLQALRHR